MQFTTGTASVCSGGNHAQLPITVNGREHILHFSRAELRDAGPEEFEEIRPAILARLRSAALESVAGTPTNAQIAAAINNKTFEV